MFMRSSRRWLGAMLDFIKGPRQTERYLGRVEHSTEKFRPDGYPVDVDLGIECRRITYRTVYARWWVPNTTHAVYEVQGFAPKDLEHLFDQHLFEKVTYPLLCSRLLLWTPIPSLYAIRAYFDRLSAPQGPKA